MDDELVAFCFDRAVLTFGNALENKLQEVAKNSKKQKEAERRTAIMFQKWISSGDSKTARGRFADPMDLLKK